MEGRVWVIVLTLVPARQVELGRLTYDRRAILVVGLWAILHDRPMKWACQPESWPDRDRPRQLPHPSTLSRRWRAEDLQAEAEAIHARALAALGPAGRYAAVDGRPLVVGGASGDAAALPGRAVGGLARGYKLHAVMDAQGALACYRVEPLPVSEQRVARELLRAAPAALTHWVGDTLYDSVPLQRAAAAAGRRLYAPLREGRVGRRQQPERLRRLRLWRRAVGRRLLHWRDAIERCFGRMSNFACGFKGLPAWCRGLHRVRRWMWGKILIYHAFLLTARQAH